MSRWVRNNARIRRFTLDALQQRSDVLVDIVIARAFPEIFGALVVVTQREISDLCQVLRIPAQFRCLRRINHCFVVERIHLLPVRIVALLSLDELFGCGNTM
jgi:hypothetical protein